MCLEIEQTNEGEERKEHESGQEADGGGRHERLQSAKSVMPFEIVKEGTLLVRENVHFPTGGMLRCCE